MTAPTRPLVVAALGGNALLRRGEGQTTAVQRANAERAAAALAALARRVDLVVTHGSGPQIGRLALLDDAADPSAQPLDVLDAEAAGMIGYVLERALRNALPEREIVTVLTQVVVSPADPAFGRPTKPVGAMYDAITAARLAAEHGWAIARDGAGWRRVVASPEPLEVVEIDPVRWLVEDGLIVICGGGGGIPVARGAGGRMEGVEAVVDKDLVSALIACELRADALLLLTDVTAVQADFGTPHARALDRLDARAVDAGAFAAGSMGPKVDAARRFALMTGGAAGIGALRDAEAILDQLAGTTVAVPRSTAETPHGRLGDSPQPEGGAPPMAGVPRPGEMTASCNRQRREES